MSAWALATWIVNKLMANLDLASLRNEYNILNSNYDNLLNQKLTISYQYQLDGEGNIIFPSDQDTSLFPDGIIHDGTICILYETDEVIIEDLTGTSWLFNTTLQSPYPSFEYNLNFTFDNSSSIQNKIISSTYGLTYQSYDELEEIGTITVAYNAMSMPASWESNDYKSITIIGGTDATNSSFISWLINNATQVVEGD